MKKSLKDKFGIPILKCEDIQWHFGEVIDNDNEEENDTEWKKHKAAFWGRGGKSKTAVFISVKTIPLS